jgi:hypothetical protein
MVSHKHIGVKRAPLLFQRFGQPVQVSVIVFIAKEAGFSVMTPLNNMQGYSIKVNAGTTWHEQTIAENPSLAPLMFQGVTLT